MKIDTAHFRGCLMGGAVGDAMGYTKDYMSQDQVVGKYGLQGLIELQRNASSHLALTSDVTQLTSFTVDGLLWADSRAKTKGIYGYIPCLFYSYQKWLYTQTGSLADKSYEFVLNGEILQWEELFARRSPGATTISTLAACINGKYGTLKKRINNSKGCGGVMRSAPIGMYFWRDPKMAFRMGCEGAAITHGHACAILPAGFFACLISFILQDYELPEAVDLAMEELKQQENMEETYEALERAIALSKEEGDDSVQLNSLGDATQGHQAMAMAVYCALRYSDDFRKAITLASNHGGNASVSAGICGNILGAYLGSLEIPFPWLRDIELSELFITGADRLLAAMKPSEEDTDEDA